MLFGTRLNSHNRPFGEAVTSEHAPGISLSSGANRNIANGSTLVFPGPTFIGTSQCHCYRIPQTHSLVLDSVVEAESSNIDSYPEEFKSCLVVMLLYFVGCQSR